MKQPICFKVVLPTTNALRTAVRHGDSFVDVERGTLYVMAATLREVVAGFPQAISVERFGVGYYLSTEDVESPHREEPRLA